MADGWNEEESARRRTRGGLAEEASPRGGVQAGVLVGRTDHPRAKPALDSWPGGRHGESQRPLYSSWEEVGGEIVKREEGLTTAGVRQQGYCGREGAA